MAAEKTTENVDRLLEQLRQLFRAQYERGGQDALKRVLGPARKTPNGKLQASHKRTAESMRGRSRAASH